jgi:hypothetical protein
LDEVKSAEMYLEEQKRLATNLMDDIPDVDISKLVDNQRVVFTKVLQHYQDSLLYESISTVLREPANHSSSGPSQRQLQLMLINKAVPLPLYELHPLILQHSISKESPYIRHSRFQ